MSSKRPRDLHVVKKETGIRPGHFLSTESLTEERREAAERYKGVAAPSALLLGAMAGRHQWDVRPVVLERGSVSVVRFCDPALQMVKSRHKAFARNCKLLDTSMPGFLGSGESEGQIWVRRRYFQVTLEDDEVEPVTRAQFLQLVRLLSRAHAKGLIHGHLTPSNLGVEGGELHPLDYGFYAFSTSVIHTSGEAAPELDAGEAPTELTDCFGLGVVGKMLLRRGLRDSEERCLEALLLEDSGGRPSLDEVEKSFSGARTTQVAKSSRIIETRTPETKHSVERSQSRRQSYMLLGAALLLLVAPLAYLRRADIAEIAGFSNGSTEIPGEGIPHDVFWASGDRHLVRQVADAAVSGNTQAQEVIVDSANRGVQIEGLREQFLVHAFNKSWREQLTADDRLVAFKLALSQLVPEKVKAIPSLSDVHPGVLFAFLASSGLNNHAIFSKSLPYEKLATLPSPHGSGFASLIGVESNPERLPAVLQSFAHLVAGELTENTVNLFFGEKEELVPTYGKLHALIPFLDSRPGVGDAAYDFLARKPTPLEHLVKWFTSEDLAKWESVSKSDRLKIVGGAIPQSQLSFEQYSDLLKFPISDVRKNASAKLQRMLPETSARTVFVLSGTQNGFTRFQNVGLLSALRLEGDASYTFLSQWFSTNPEPATVLSILIERRTIEKLDPFNVEAARYLSRKEWPATFDQVKDLSTHPEPLARSLAYTKLDVNDPKQLEVLESMAKVEPSGRVRALIQQKLKSRL